MTFRPSRVPRLLMPTTRSAWSTTAIDYDVSIDSPEAGDVIARLLETVEIVAEIPRVVRGDVTVSRR